MFSEMFLQASCILAHASKFICISDDGMPKLLITENDTSYKNNIYKNRMMWILYHFKI